MDLEFVASEAELQPLIEEAIHQTYQSNLLYVTISVEACGMRLLTEMRNNGHFPLPCGDQEM